MAGIFPHGTTVEWGSIRIGGLTDVPIPERDREEVEVTDHDSQFNREYVPGLIDNGTYELPLRLVPGDAGQEALVASLGNPEDIQQVTITLPDHASPRYMWTFNAWVKTMGGELPWENTAASRSVVFRVTGAVTESELSS